MNWSAMILVNSGPRSDPATWSSAMPPSKGSMLFDASRTPFAAPAAPCTLLVIWAKLVTGGQTVGLAHLVVRADAVVARALDVAGDQVLAVVLQAAVGEQQIADVARSPARSSAWETPSASPLRMGPMSVDVWPVSGSTTPLGLRTFGSKKSVGQTDVGAGGIVRQHVLAVVALPLDAAAEQAVAEPEGHGGKLGGDRGIDVGVVARCRPAAHSARAGRADTGCR